MSAGRPYAALQEAPRLRRLSRRRLIGIVGASTVLGALPIATRNTPGPLAHEWRGVALGAWARILLYHDDRTAAVRTLGACVAEIERLEREFSLYRPDSALSILNRSGRLVQPSIDMRRLMSEALRFGDLSSGVFDVTIQPLWRLYADHFTAAANSEKNLDRRRLEAALSLVDFRRVDVTQRSIDFSRPGMAVTLNGIAQGFITDRVAELLGNSGFTYVLVDVGELRAQGHRPDGRPWRIALARSPNPTREIMISDEAVATSAGGGTRFEASGRFNHIIDPRTGRCADPGKTVSVIAESATAADAIATSICLLDHDRAMALLHKVGSARVLVNGENCGLHSSA